MPTSVTWQPGLLPPVRVCRAMALLNLPAEWYCPSFSGTCPVKEMPGWNDLVFLGISHVCRRYTRHLLFLFLLFKRKNRDSSSGLSSWKGKRVSLTAELLESCSVLWKCADVFKGLQSGWVQEQNCGSLSSGFTVELGPLFQTPRSLMTIFFFFLSRVSLSTSAVWLLFWGVGDKMGLRAGVRSSVNVHYLMIIFPSESLFVCF